ncbi:MAG: response regulator, partial [Nitrospirota bacterium]
MSERILIVEDEETLSSSLRRVFLRDGYEAEVVDNAESALEMLDKGIYDIIITDII